MTIPKKEMSKTHRAMLIAVLEALKAHDCINSYTLDGRDALPEWRDDGFDRAFEELKTNAKPLDLKKKGERAWLHILLAQKDKKTVDDFIFSSFKQRYGL
jgi:hypothetical protein